MPRQPVMPPANRLAGAVSLLAGVGALLVALDARGARGLGFFLGGTMWLLTGGVSDSLIVGLTIF